MKNDQATRGFFFLHRIYNTVKKSGGGENHVISSKSTDSIFMKFSHIVDKIITNILVHKLF